MAPFDFRFLPQLPGMQPPPAPPTYGPDGLTDDERHFQMLYEALMSQQAPMPPPNWQQQVGGAIPQAPVMQSWSPMENFGAGLIGGLGRGLSLRGERKQQEQAKKNQANIAATQEILGARAKRLGEKLEPSLERIRSESQARAEGRAAGTPDVQRGPGFLSAQDMYARAKATAEGSAAGRAGTVPGGQVKTPLTPEAIEMNARSLAATGKSNISVRDVESQREVQNRAAKLYPGIDLARNAATYKSNNNSLSSLVKLRDGVQAFTETADRNLLILDEKAQAIGGFDSPLANRPMRWFQKNMQGSPEMAAYEAARATVAKEYSRILTTLAGSGQVTDAAQKELDNIVSGNYGLAQMRATLDVLKRDAVNRGIAYNNRIDEITARTGAPQADRVRVSGPNGETGTMPSTSKLPKGWKVVP